jgi:hypothetical protein
VAHAGSVEQAGCVAGARAFEATRSGHLCPYGVAPASEASRVRGVSSETESPLFAAFFVSFETSTRCAVSLLTPTISAILRVQPGPNSPPMLLPHCARPSALVH